MVYSQHMYRVALHVKDKKETILKTMTRDNHNN